MNSTLTTVAVFVKSCILVMSCHLLLCAVICCYMLSYVAMCCHLLLCAVICRYVLSSIALCYHLLLCAVICWMSTIWVSVWICVWCMFAMYLCLWNYACVSTWNYTVHVISACLFIQAAENKKALYDYATPQTPPPQPHPQVS